MKLKKIQESTLKVGNKVKIIDTDESDKILRNKIGIIEYIKPSFSGQMVGIKNIQGVPLSYSSYDTRPEMLELVKESDQQVRYPSEEYTLAVNEEDEPDERAVEIKESLNKKLLSRAKKIQEDVAEDMWDMSTEPESIQDTNITIDEKPIEKKAIDLISEPVQEGEEEVAEVENKFQGLTKEEKRALVMKLAKGVWSLDDLVNELSGISEGLVKVPVKSLKGENLKFIKDIATPENRGNGMYNIYGDVKMIVKTLKSSGISDYTIIRESKKK